MENGLNYDNTIAEMLINILFPYKVYRKYSETAPDSTEPLMILEAGFREKEDAELFAEIKKNATNGDYIVMSIQQNETDDSELF